MDRPIKALLVEDIPEVSRVIVKVVEAVDRGIHIDVVQTLADTVDWLSKSATDVIVLDLMLPDAKDLEALRVVRGLAPDIPVVVLTGSEAVETESECLQHGAEDFIRKSVLKSNEIVEKIRHAVIRASVRRGMAACKEPLDKARAIIADKITEIRKRE